MTYKSRLISVILVISVIISAFFTDFSLNAATPKKGVVNADSLRIREGTSTSTRELGRVSGGQTVAINYEAAGQLINNSDGYSNIWYNITYNGVTGFVSSIYIAPIPEYTYDQSFENHIAAFPESYKPYLRELHAQYPNWRFTPDNLSMTLDEAVVMQGVRKVTTYGESWRSLSPEAYNWSTGQWTMTDAMYYPASREVVKYYMDPRSYLNSTSIYAFLPQNFDASTQNEEGIKKIIKSTFMENNYYDPNDTAYGGSYSKVLMAAAQSSGVNPYILAALIIQEQGILGDSPLISGTYSGYEGLYNFFNVGAYGNTREEIYINGLNNARNRSWTTRSAAIIGGAAFCADGYITANQNTYYYMNFNMKNPGALNHQYARAIHDTNSKAYGVSKNYKDMYQSELTFLIPVYKDTYGELEPLPPKNKNLNNYYFTDISVAGLNPGFSMINYNYSLSVSADTNINVSVPDKAAYVGAGQFNLNPGYNKVVLTVKAQSGYTTDYIINVTASNACTIYIKTQGTAIPDIPNKPVESYKKGDINGDGSITVSDMASVRLHLLGKLTLSTKAFEAADINGDNMITVSDMATVRLHLLGKYTIS